MRKSNQFGNDMTGIEQMTRVMLITAANFFAGWAMGIEAISDPLSIATPQATIIFWTVAHCNELTMGGEMLYLLKARNSKVSRSRMETMSTIVGAEKIQLNGEIKSEDSGDLSSISVDDTVVIAK